MKRFRRPLLLVFLALSSLGVAGAASLLAADPAEEKPPATAPGAVEVHLSEYVVKMPETLPAGPTTFALHNDGNKKHAFKIEGPGIEGTQSAILEPHATGELKVTLQPGEYKIYCPIGSHSIKGMSVKLVVTGTQGG
ncbi:MAG TPA: cupredoxin domain-containing protein [Thermoanaerobaculia bacterium]|nr:cupredoxin domain-containing protein [Thermoanaerobaculia bacterium]